MSTFLGVDFVRDDSLGALAHQQDIEPTIVHFLPQCRGIAAEDTSMALTHSYWTSLIVDPSQKNDKGAPLAAPLIGQLLQDRQLRIDDLFAWHHPAVKTLVFGKAGFGDQTVDVPLWVAWVLAHHAGMREDAVDQILGLCEQHMYRPDWMAVVAQSDNGLVRRGIDVLSWWAHADAFEKALTQLPSADLAALHAAVPSAKLPGLSVHALVPYSWDNVDVLLRHGWDIDQKNSNNNTALMESTTWARAEQLLQRHANIWARTNTGNSIWDLATAWHRTGAEARDIQNALTHFAEQQSNNAPAAVMPPKISALFHAISTGTQGQAPALFRALKNIDNPNHTVATNMAGLTVAQALVRMSMQRLSTNRRAALKDVAMNYRRYHIHAHLHSAAHSWVDLDRASDPSFPTLTDRDCLMFGELLLADHDVLLADPALGVAVASWCAQRFPQVSHVLPQWLDAHKNVGVRANALEKILESFLGGNSYRDPVKKSLHTAINKWWNALPPSDSIAQQICARSDKAAQMIWQRNLVPIAEQHEETPSWMLQRIVAACTDPQLAEADRHIWEKALFREWSSFVTEAALEHTAADRSFSSLALFEQATSLVMDDAFVARNRGVVAEWMDWFFVRTRPAKHNSYHYDEYEKDLGPMSAYDKACLDLQHKTYLRNLEFFRILLGNLEQFHLRTHVADVAHRDLRKERRM